MAFSLGLTCGLSPSVAARYRCSPAPAIRCAAGFLRYAPVALAPLRLALGFASVATSSRRTPSLRFGASGTAASRSMPPRGSASLRPFLPPAAWSFYARRLPPPALLLHHLIRCGSCYALPCAPPPRRPRWGLRGAQGWFGAGCLRFFTELIFKASPEKAPCRKFFTAVNFP